MKRILQFLKITLLGGFFFLVPVVVVVVVIGKALVVTDQIATPLAAHLPVRSVIGLRTSELLAIVLMVLVCFLAGFLAKLRHAQQLVARLEAAVLSHLPGYEFLKGMGESALGVEGKGAYPAVLAHFDDAWQIGFQVERLENGLVAVFIPDAPMAHTGAVQFLTADRVTPLDLPPAAALKCLKRLGAGSNALLRGTRSSGAVSSDQ